MARATAVQSSKAQAACAAPIIPIASLFQEWLQRLPQKLHGSFTFAADPRSLAVRSVNQPYQDACQNAHDQEPPEDQELLE